MENFKNHNVTTWEVRRKLLQAKISWQISSAVLSSKIKWLKDNKFLAAVLTSLFTLVITGEKTGFYCHLNAEHWLSSKQISEQRDFHNSVEWDILTIHKRISHLKDIQWTYNKLIHEWESHFSFWINLISHIETDQSVIFQPFIFQQYYQVSKIYLFNDQ